MDKNTTENTSENISKNYEYIVLSGGAAKGLSYIGVLEYLEEEKQILEKIKEFIGCSIGAFSALIIILGYNSVDLKKIFNNYNLNLLKSFRVSEFFNSYGLDNGKKIELFIKIFLKNKNLNENITLSELYKKTNKKLITVVTNVNSKKTEYISIDTYPDIPVFLAVQMSMCIPFIYNPIKYNNRLYVDGGLTCNFPIRYYVDKEVDYNKILCFSFNEKHKNEEINSFEKYLFNILKSSFYTIENEDRKFAQYKECSIVSISIDISNSFNLDIDEDNKNLLYKYGYDAIKEFIESKNKKKE